MTVAEERLVRAPFSGTIEYAQHFFEQHRHLGLYAATVTVRSTVVDDAADLTRKHEALEIAWRAPTTLLPDLHALLTVRPQAPGSRLFFTADYTPPLGRVGKVFDALIGRHIAHATFTSLLARLTRDIERQHAEFSQRHSVAIQ